MRTYYIDYIATIATIIGGVRASLFIGHLMRLNVRHRP